MLIRSCAAALLSFLAASPSLAQVGGITVDAGRGPISVSLPSTYDPATPAPLIVLLHGYGASGAGQEAYMRFTPIQDDYGYVFCAPDGTMNATGARFWNATNACCDFQNSNVDDVGYIIDLVEAIEAAVSIDPRSIHLIGHSNGGFMSYRVACERADKIASIASLAGATFSDPADCTGAGPVHILQIHGTNDGTIDYTGGAIFGQSYPSALGTVERWAARNGCDPTTETEDMALNLVSSLAGRETSRTRFPNLCVNGGSVELWTIQGGSHTPALSPFFGRRVVEHLLARPKVGTDVESYCGPAVPNSSGSPAVMGATGSDVIADNALTLTASGMPIDAFGFFLTSQTEGFSGTPSGEGNICLGGSIGRFSATVLNSGTTGSFELTVDLSNLPGNPPVSAMSGETWRFQAWFRDANPTVTSNFTDGLRVSLK